MSTTKTICTMCNYIYDETLGDSKGNVPPSVPFNSLGESWLCPDCGASKDMFQPCSCVTLSTSDELKAMTVGQLVAGTPRYARVFDSFGIDFCCGGKRPLAEVCLEKNIDIDALLEKLNSAAMLESDNEPDWNQTSLKELTNHIIQNYHGPLREELTRTEALAKKVATVHGERHPEMAVVASIFSNFKAELELHMQKEETVLFPAIVRSEGGDNPQVFGCGGGIENPIKVMLQEHDGAGDALKSFRQLTNDYTPPADACNTFRVLLDSLNNIEREMHQHVHKENNILFPRALMLGDRTLSTCK